MAKKKDTIVKTITITVEESLVDGRIIQNVGFDLQNISSFEALGLMRLYEQKMSISILKGAND
jgi:hypothetical protein